MPFAGYKDFNSCVADQKSKGHDDDSAHKICGYLYNKLEKAAVQVNYATMLLEDIQKAKWSKKYIDDLPDSAFLVIESGGTKEDGKTTPKSLRHFPVRDADGKLDLPHLRNALSRIPQSKLPQGVKDKAKAKAQRLLASSTEKAAADAIDKARKLAKPRGMYKGDMASGDPASGGKLVPQQMGGQMAGAKKKPKPIVNGIQETGHKDMSVVAIARKYDIKKFVESPNMPPEEHYVLGVVLEPETEDAQHDIYDEETIRKTAHEYMANHQDIGLQHNGTVEDRVKILESYLAPCDFELNGQTIKKGTWMLAARVYDDALWQDVKKGNLTGWSIGGSAIRTPVGDPNSVTS